MKWPFPIKRKEGLKFLRKVLIRVVLYIIGEFIL